MILNVKFPPLQGYNSPMAAIVASKAKSAEFAWFNPKEIRGQLIEDTSWGFGWFALRLSNNKRILISPGETVLTVGLDNEPLPKTEPFAQQVEIKSKGVNGPYSYNWNVESEARAMIGQLITQATFHQHHLILTLRDCCAWFWLMTDLDTEQQTIKWNYSD